MIPHSQRLQREGRPRSAWPWTAALQAVQVCRGGECPRWITPVGRHGREGAHDHSVTRLPLIFSLSAIWPRVLSATLRDANGPARTRQSLPFEVFTLST